MLLWCSANLAYILTNTWLLMALNSGLYSWLVSLVYWIWRAGVGVPAVMDCPSSWFVSLTLTGNLGQSTRWVNQVSKNTTQHSTAQPTYLDLLLKGGYGDVDDDNIRPAAAAGVGLCLWRDHKRGSWSVFLRWGRHRTQVRRLIWPWRHLCWRVDGGGGEQGGQWAASGRTVGVDDGSRSKGTGAWSVQWSPRCACTRGQRQ